MRKKGLPQSIVIIQPPKSNGSWWLDRTFQSGGHTSETKAELQRLTKERASAVPGDRVVGTTYGRT